MWRRLAMPLVRPVTVAVALLAFIASLGQLPRPARLSLRPRSLHAAARVALALGARPHELPGAARGRGRRDGAGRHRVRGRSAVLPARGSRRRVARPMSGVRVRRGREALRRGRPRSHGVTLAAPRGSCSSSSARPDAARARCSAASPGSRPWTPGRSRSAGATSRALAPGAAQRLDGVPELRALPAHDGRGEHRLRARVREAPKREVRERVAEASSARRARAPARAAARTSSPAASVSGSRSRGRSCASRTRSSSTSRSRTSTRARVSRCGRAAAPARAASARR